MKTLANCTPLEFLTQANKIRLHAEKWLKDTDILNIRKNLPELEKVPSDATLEERERIVKSNKEKTEAQVHKNLSEILEAILSIHPEETLELIALCCFIEPEKANEQEVSEYLLAISELIGNEAVLSFFTSLARLGQRASDVA